MTEEENSMTFVFVYAKHQSKEIGKLQKPFFKRTKNSSVVASLKNMKQHFMLQH